MVRGHQAPNPGMKFSRSRSCWDGEIQPINHTGLDKAACPNQCGFGLAASGRRFNYRQPFIERQVKRSDLSRTRLAPFEQTECRSAAVPAAPGSAIQDISRKLIRLAGLEGKAGGHPVGSHQNASKQVLGEGVKRSFSLGSFAREKSAINASLSFPISIIGS